MTMKEKSLKKFGKGQENGIRILPVSVSWWSNFSSAAKFLKC